MPNPLTVWITTNCVKFLNWWEYKITLSVSWETCMWVKKQQLKLDMEQLSSSKFGKEYFKTIYCHPAYLTYIHHGKCQTGWITGWNQGCRQKYQQPQICIWHHSKSRKGRTKETLDESEKTGLKLNIQKTNIMASGPINSYQIEGKTWEWI